LSKHALQANFVKKSKTKKNHFEIISITQNTFYTYGPAFKNTYRKKVGFAPSPRNYLDKWSSNWKIKINAAKSVHVPFTLNKKNLPTPTLHEIPIPSSSQVKYLGIILGINLGPPP